VVQGASGDSLTVRIEMTQRRCSSGYISTALWRGAKWHKERAINCGLALALGRPSSSEIAVRRTIVKASSRAYGTHNEPLCDFSEKHCILSSPQPPWRGEGYNAVRVWC
jgi:hypothetical protein